MVLTELNKYFTVPDVPYKPIEGAYDMKLDAQVVNHPHHSGLCARIDQNGAGEFYGPAGQWAGYHNAGFG